MLRRTASRLALLLLAGWPACAQTIYPPINTPVFRALDANGKPLSGGELYTYVAGSSTPQSTYADPGGASPNTNPVILDSTGSAKIFLAPQNYKFVLQDANGVQQWTVDNITGAPPQSEVTSVFGRKGNVVAVAGDYTCSQITGAVCSIPTIYYQTIRAGGTDLTQRARLNLLAGSNITLNCVDNSGSNSTDCTVTANLPTSNIAGSISDVTDARSTGAVYQNTNPYMIYVSGYYNTQGSIWAQVSCIIGATASPDLPVDQSQYGATTENKPAGFRCMVPAGYYYKVTTDGSGWVNLQKWYETAIH